MESPYWRYNVDITETTHISLCAGYGGIDLGLKAVIPNLRTVAYVEIEAFAVANLVAKMEAGQMDAAPIWSDIKTFPGEEFCNKVHIISGGYPCQPFSHAGKRKGKDDPRHLWPYIRNIVSTIRPFQCFFENVEGHITSGLSSVLSDLGEMGYRATWGIFSASECGSPHQRKRVFILAHDRSESKEKKLADNNSERIKELNGKISTEQRQYSFGDSCWPSRPGEAQYEWEPPRVVGNSESNNKRRVSDGKDRKGKSSGGSSCRELVISGDQRLSKREPGAFEKSTEEFERSAGSRKRKIESSMGRDSNGDADRMDYAELCESCDSRIDELRLLGNGVVPQVAAKAYLELNKRLTKE